MSGGNYGECDACGDITDLDEDLLCKECIVQLEQDEDDEDCFESGSDFEDRPDPTRLRSPRDQEV